MVALEVLEQLAQAGERRACVVRMVDGRRNRHQAAQDQPIPPSDILGQCGELIRAAAGFLGFVIDVDLDQHVQRWKIAGPLIAETASNLEPVHALDPVEPFGQGPCLVRLDGADEVPRQWQIGQRFLLGTGLIDIVFAEGALPEFGQRPNLAGIPGLADRQKLDRRGCTIGSPAGGFDARLDLGEPGLQRVDATRFGGGITV